MSFPYDDCRGVLFRALLAALRKHDERIKQLAAAQVIPVNRECGIDGISFDILPWHQFVALSFRVYNDEPDAIRFRYSPADWKHYEFIGDDVFDETREYTSLLHSAGNDGPAQHEIMHLIYMAAADALLDSQIASILQSCGINAPSNTDHLPKTAFEYMVLDEDRVIKANYCEILIANRITERLLDNAV